MRRLLSKVLPDPDRVELIRQRVYTHNARLAERCTTGCCWPAMVRVHIMPVWQGQGIQQRHARRLQPGVEAGAGGQR
ncbi:hypothetical protein MJ585_16485 [Klebsiella pneumoniae]|nr:hypothetical protein MJ585_16485 [Klebsiella pneumoniae]